MIDGSVTGVRRQSRHVGWRWVVFALQAWVLVAGLAACGSAERRDVFTTSDETEADRRARVRLELASAYFSRGQYTTALDEVKQALAVKPESMDALNLRGLVYGALKEPQLAEDSFRRALSINGRHGDTLHNLGWFLCQQRRFVEADALFVQALAQPSYRETTRTLLAQGVCAARANRWGDAERILLQAFEQDPGSPTIAVNLSEVLYRRGEFERARFYVRRVNSNEELTSAQSLWLAIRIEQRLNQPVMVRALGRQLTTQFAASPEAQLFQKGLFDE